MSFSKSWNCTSRFGEWNFSFLKNSQVSYPTSANGIIVLLNSLNSKNLKYEIRAKKARKPERNRKKLDEDALLCNILWSDRCNKLIAKNINFLAISRTSKRRYWSKLSKKIFFFFFGFIQRKISLSGENIFSLATLSTIIYHIRSN